MVKREDQHNTPEQAHAYLAAALALVAELDPPEDLRVACFVKAADLLSAKQLFYEQTAAPALGLPNMTLPRHR